MARTLAITLGDPQGIGLEVSIAATARLLAEAPDTTVLAFGADGLSVPGATYMPVGAWDGSRRGAGQISIEAIRRAVALALGGHVDAVITAPVHKPALHAAGWNVPGQTELLERLAGGGPVGMLMDAEQTRCGGALRVLLATTHLPLRDVPARLTPELLIEQTELLYGSLREGWQIESPRIALCALNPHASDEGLFGDEEARVYGPALDALGARGITATGPVPADTVFRRALDESFDAVVAPYHDVGMAAFKTAAFGGGVNVTLGLPFVRTSPDHGTAFDLVGRGKADPASMLEALKLARRLAEARFDTAARGV